MIKIVFYIMFTFIGTVACGQERRTKKLIIITLDGMRWQEVFGGADDDIFFNDRYNKDKDVVEKFWDSSPNGRREKLMPFFWNVIGKEGQLYGNRNFKNKVNCTNPHLFSYPGYSEMLVGFVDKRVKSNDKIENPNFTVLGYANQQKHLNGKVAVFSTWDVVPYIIRASSADIYANAGPRNAKSHLLAGRQQLFNELLPIADNARDDQFDTFTFMYAMEYIEREKPDVLFLSFDETDEHAHGGKYDEYLKSAHRTDQMIGMLWAWLQSQDNYKDKTTLLITTDHGRGKGARKSWKDHGMLKFGSSQVWWAVIGPDTPATGEMKIKGQYFQKQFAKTAAAFLGLQYLNVQPVGEVVHSMLAKSKG